MKLTLETIVLTDTTGLTLAYKSSSLRSWTMGDEYPVTLLVGELGEQLLELRPAEGEDNHEPDRTKQCTITLLQGTESHYHVNDPGPTVINST